MTEILDKVLTFSWTNIAALLGIGGFILGIVNLVRSVQADRVKLLVEPALAYYMGDQIFSFTNDDNIESTLKRHGLPIIALQVTNLGKFPVTIYEVGFANQNPNRGGRSPILKPPNNEGLPWPTRLESREAVTYRTEVPITEYPFTFSTRAYARTKCGHAVLGDSPAFRFWRNLAAANQQK